MEEGNAIKGSTSLHRHRMVAVSLFNVKSGNPGPLRPGFCVSLTEPHARSTGADIVILATNRHITPEGIQFAASQAIHLMDGKSMRTWVCWGDSIYDLLQIPGAAATS